MTVLFKPKFFGAAIVAIITGCSRYSVSINQNVLYEPPTLFSQYDLADATLKECVRSTIAEKGLTKAEQLTQLICGPGDIANLSGIETFAHIEHLGLSRNQIEQIDVLEKLPHLKQLQISHNQIKDFSALKTLDKLVFLNSSGNNKAACGSFELPQQSLEKVLPKHCR